MSRPIIERDKVAFLAEGRLLQEIGERLVAKPNIALVELIKNSFDADARECNVQNMSSVKALVVQDDGVGMTKEQFLQRWMKIATAHKIDEPVSPRYGRRRTGQKGIGRFAVRFLGQHLSLSTIADDPERKIRTEVRAKFDWKRLDRAATLDEVEIEYTLLEAAPDAKPGTTLRIGDLRHDMDFLESKDFRTDVLKIVSPLKSLDRGRFQPVRSEKHDVDPGFHVILPSGDGPGEVDIGKEVLERAWARLHIDFDGDIVRYEVLRRNVKKARVLNVKMERKLKAGLVADIRYFPRRQGVFSEASVDGRAAWSWVRENCGVAVVDNGFRIFPFGFEEDDWLRLDLDSSHNRRNWRSRIAGDHFPIADEIRARPGENPALNLPSNFQLVGAVFVESAGSGAGDDLVVATDREGFLKNEAYLQLVDVVRGGIEFLALVDKEQLAEQEERDAHEASARARADFRAAIESIRSSPTLTKGDKNRLVEHYSTLSTKLEEVEEYGRQARRRLETMGLLGVVAGFMTHEASRILDGLEMVLERLSDLKKKDPSFAESAKQIEDGYLAFKGHVDYTTLFIESMHREGAAEFKAAPQIDRILERFGTFADGRGISAKNEIADSVRLKGIPVAAYSGILLNLYSNAVKAVVARIGRAAPPHIVFRAWTEGGQHNVEVMDKGVGIPPEVQSRIFDPLFTTTSNTGNPLGSGMGLGLSLVRDVVGQFDGRVKLVDPPADFATCFRVVLPGGK